MYKTKRPPMYKSTVKRVTYPKMFIRRERKWCYHFFHVKMRMILSFGEKQKTVIQKCTNSLFGSENVHIPVKNVHFQLISALIKWTFTFFAHFFDVRMYIYISSGSHLSARMNIFNLWECTFHPLPCVKIDWKFRANPLNWSWQQTCSRRMNIYIFHRRNENEHLQSPTGGKIDWKFRVIPLNWSWQQTCSQRMNIYIFPAASPVFNTWVGDTWVDGTRMNSTWMDGNWMYGTSWPCTSHLCTKMYIL